MSLFHFHLSECGEVTFDEEGCDMTGIVEAERYAVQSARALMCDAVSNGKLDLECHIDIQDAAGIDLLAVPFNLAVRVSR